MIIDRITGARIYLRNLTGLDATDDYCCWLNDPEVNYYLETRKATIDDLKDYIQNKNAKSDSIFLGIFLRASDKHIGNIKLEPIDRQEKKATISIMLGDKGHWGFGYGREAISLLTGYAFDKLDINTIDLGVISENRRAIKAYEKAGFKKTRTIPGSIDHDKKRFDKIMMELRKSPESSSETIARSAKVSADQPSSEKLTSDRSSSEDLSSGRPPSHAPSIDNPSSAGNISGTNTDSDRSADRSPAQSAKPNIVCIIQARMGSTRLPGKVLKELDGNPMIHFVLSQMSKSALIDKIVVASTKSPDDRKILEYVKSIGYPVVAGSEDDVLDRYYQAAVEHDADVIVRITADCPLIDPVVVDKVIDRYLQTSADYCSNVQPPTYPDGLDVEVFPMAALKTAHEEALLQSEREHVTPFIWKRKDRFSIVNVADSKDRSHIRLTVDEKEDLDLVRELVKRISKRPVELEDVMDVLESSPGLLKINNQFERNEGYAKSIKEDKVVTKDTDGSRSSIAPKPSIAPKTSITPKPSITPKQTADAPDGSPIEKDNLEEIPLPNHNPKAVPDMVTLTSKAHDQSRDQAHAQADSSISKSSQKKTTIFVTGGSGFIGTNFIRYLMDKTDYNIINFDALTYAGNPENLSDLESHPRYSFVRGNICNRELVRHVMQDADIVCNFAAESHVDRSIENSYDFHHTNIIGTSVLLDVAKELGIKRFLQISTDEVYGSLSLDSRSSVEGDPLKPSSPYSSSKAAAEHIALAYHITYNMPVIITRSSNNYGPYQYPEKLIPLFITNLMQGKKVPLMGKGENVRDWIFVEDNCAAILRVLEHGTPGEIYNIGGENERTNMQITEAILDHMDKDKSWIDEVPHRLGHDLRYSLDCRKVKDLGWTKRYSFEQGMRKTVEWYKQNQPWWQRLKK